MLQIKEQLSVSEYQGGYFLTRDLDGYGRGLYDADGSFVSKSGRRTYGEGAAYVDEDKRLDTRSTAFREIDEPVVYAGYLMLHYGHFLIDGMIRLWYLASHPELRDYRILLTHQLTDRVPDYIYEVFARLTGHGSEQLLVVQEPVHLTGSVYVPEWSYVPGEYISPAFLQPFQTIAAQVTPAGEHMKLYLSRRGLKGHEYGERTIEQIFEANGYRILRPETIPFTEQIAYYRAADVLVSTAGTLGHNILWCRPDCRQVLLQRLPEITQHQAAIDQIRGSDSEVIDCGTPDAEHGLSCLYVTDALRDFLEKEGYSCHYSKADYLAARVRYRLRMTMHRIKRTFRRTA